MTTAVKEQQFKFGTKGETLERLAPLLGREHFMDQYLFTVAEWRVDVERVLRSIFDRFVGMTALAVRSSARGEDGVEFSMAGAYTSIISVALQWSDVQQAVEKVIASYSDGDDGHHVLVQPMIENVVIAGVVLTRELDTGSPYYVVNYDDATGRTDEVTGGRGENKCILIRRDHVEGLRSPRFRSLLRIVQEIERIASSDQLDIEFCVTADDCIYVMQVRPLAAKRNWSPLNDDEVHRAVQTIKDEILLHNQPRPGVSGRRTIFGEMPDWNPAEMIGNCPKPLALSLYRYLITDASWATARRNMTYRKVPEDPLLVSFGGRPYIDVRLSLNSFLPEGIDGSFAEELIDWQLERLAANPELHDKIEFTIASTCRDLDFGSYRKELSGAGFTANAVDRFGIQLQHLTARCVAAESGHLQELYGRTRALSREAASLAAMPEKKRALRLLRNCIRGGVIPFAELARHAFIGIAFLKSAVKRGVLSHDDIDAMIKGVHTVAGEFVQDMHRLSNGDMIRNDFLARYGHLRPGTYDITSWRYDEHPELYLTGHSAGPPVHAPFIFSAPQKSAMERLLREEGYDFGLEVLCRYITQAVRFREAAKFEFTKSVSDALRALTTWGEAVDLSRDELSYLRIDQIESDDDRATLMELVAQARERYDVTRALRLPHMIVTEQDAEVVRLPLGRPTFITSKCVTAPVRMININEVPEFNSEIVLIESADPGFDWIFSRRISGLITKYGGANSHMAIRCAEFDLPAAIGCGERMFDMVAREHSIELNCAARTIKQVQ